MACTMSYDRAYRTLSENSGHGDISCLAGWHISIYGEIEICKSPWPSPHSEFSMVTLREEHVQEYRAHDKSVGDSGRNTAPHAFVMSKTTTSQSTASPDDIRRLVLDYLCNNCYSDTARAFARDSTPRELDKDGDEILLDEGNEYGLDSTSLHFVRLRKEIQAHIMAGNIPECIESLNNNFPDVLSPKFTGSPYDASHLHLNLKIQHFVEQARTLPLPWPHDTGAKFNHRQSQVDNPVAEEEELERKRRLLSLMEELYSLVYALPGNSKDRDIYITELNAVGGLLAYPVPEKSRDLRKYLDKARREAVADQINEAILYRMNKTVPSIIELVARQATVLFSTLHCLNHPLPSVEQRPAALKNLLSKVMSATQDTKSSKGDKEKDKENEEVTSSLSHENARFIDNVHRQIVPIFELSTFLGTEA